MDGNNRWSKKNNISKFESYKLGGKKIFKLANYIFSKYSQVNYVSAFALSTHNLKRPKKILNIIFNLFDFFLDNLHKEKLDFKILFMGDLSIFSETLRKKIKKIEKINIKSKKKLIFFVNYSGVNDIKQSYYRFLKLNSKSQNFDIEKFILTKDLPNPDVLIRTGGYKRISDFMLFNISFTELFFLDKLWPDFNYSDLRKCINKFNLIERKFGS
jgi:undecaprenyl diphosphate synthase